MKFSEAELAEARERLFGPRERKSKKVQKPDTERLAEAHRRLFTLQDPHPEADLERIYEDLFGLNPYRARRGDR